MTTEVPLPDIGDFTDVPIIEIHVSAGDVVAADDPVLTLESDKATMDVPAPMAGTVTDVRVAVGDRISQGDVMVLMEPAGQDSGPHKERIHEDAEPTSGEPAGYGSPSGVYDRLEVKVPDI